MQTVLLVIHLILAISLVGFILVQRTSADGLGGIGGGGGGGSNFLTGRASANLLTRTTAIIATLFILNSLALAFIASHRSQPASLLDTITAPKPAAEQPQKAPEPAKEAPKQEPIVPMAE